MCAEVQHEWVILVVRRKNNVETLAYVSIILHGMSTVVPAPVTMSNKLSAPALFGRPLATPFSKYLGATRPHSWFPPARRRLLFQARKPAAHSTATRSFSVAQPRKFADVDDSFDPRRQDRESDNVDICIVGGGTLDLPVSDHIILMLS